MSFQVKNTMFYYDLLDICVNLYDLNKNNNNKKKREFCC